MDHSVRWLAAIHFKNSTARRWRLRPGQGYTGLSMLSIFACFELFSLHLYVMVRTLTQGHPGRREGPSAGQAAQPH